MTSHSDGDATDNDRTAVAGTVGGSAGDGAIATVGTDTDRADGDGDLAGDHRDLANDGATADVWCGD